MRLTIQEAPRWWPLLAVAALALVYWLGGHPSPTLAMLGLVDPRVMFAKIERYRRHGLDVVVACELAAEQEGANAEQVAVEHFAWKLKSAGIDSRREVV